MNVASLAILPVSVGCVEFLDGAAAAALLSFVGAQVMAEGATVLVEDAPLLHVVAVRLREVAAIAGHQFVGESEMSQFMLMGMVLGNDQNVAGAGAKGSKSGFLVYDGFSIEFLICLELVTAV